MKLSTRTRYGLRALMVIARSDKESLTSDSISRTENISKKYMDEILGKLRRAGILQTRRGAHGGYALNLDVEDLTILNVVETLDGPIALAPCAKGNYACQRDDCLARPVWQALTDGIRALMERVTLGQVVNADCCVVKEIEAMVASLGEQTAACAE